MTETTAPTLYTEVAGTNCWLGDLHGIVTGINRERGRIVSAFVKADEGGMYYVTLGAAVGERGAHHEALRWEQVDRDAFDRLTTLDVLRAEMGWRS